MKSADIKTGETYLAKVSGRLQRVRILGDCTRYNPTRHGWRAVNLATGRQIRIKGPQRLRPLDWAPKPDPKPAEGAAPLPIPVDLGDFMQAEVTRNILRYAVQRNMFCGCCQDILDVRRAAHVDAQAGYAVLCSRCLDKYRDQLKPGCQIIDGRELEKAGVL